jgi:hypothetical protein
MGPRGSSLLPRNKVVFRVLKVANVPGDPTPEIFFSFFPSELGGGRSTDADTIIAEILRKPVRLRECNTQAVVAF